MRVVFDRLTVDVDVLNRVPTRFLDKARGMPESMIPVAEEKTQEIRAAYDAIKDSRGMR